MTKPRIDIVVPVYNEGEAIRRLYDHMVASLDAFDWRAWFVYDFEKDTTVPTLRSLAAADKRVQPVMQTYGKGVLNALKFGFTQVHDGAVAVVMGDCSDDLTLLGPMYDKFKRGAAVVACSRYSKGGTYEGGELLKKTLSRVAGLTLFAAGIGTLDPTNNYKLYDGRFLRETVIESKAGFELALELTVKARLAGKKVDEVPGSWKDRTEGKSNFKLVKWLPHYLGWYLKFFAARAQGSKISAVG